jgi:CubicO group peptidase (beta-lactamase class C family)
VRDGDRLDVDELESAAIEAWLGQEPGAFGADDDALPGGVEDGFAERVLAAESAVVAVPIIVPFESSGPLPLPGRRAPIRTPLQAIVLWAAASLLVAVSGLWIATREEQDQTDVAAAAVPEVVDADDPFRPEPAMPAAVPIPTDLDEQISTYIDDYGQHFGSTFEFHGTILVARDGKIHYSRGFGIADPTKRLPNESDTRFRIGMLTEQFTAAAILQLRDAGMLQLSDTVADHLPEYSQGGPDGRRITIEQLLDHTSGIPNYTDLPQFHRWKALPHRTEELVGRFSELPLEFEPGSDFDPTNSGYYLLGAIIERTSGMSYGEYVQKYIVEPTGMTATGFGDAYHTGQQARGNVWNEEEKLDPPDPIDMSVFGAAGGLTSTALDLARWDAALYEGRVLSHASVEQMFDPNRYGYGFGWLVDEAYDQRTLWFPGAIDGFNSAILRFTGDRTLVVVLCNTEVVPALRVAQDIGMMLYGEQPPPRIEYPEVQIAPGTLSRYVGEYGITDDTIRVLGEAVNESELEVLQTVYVKQIGERLYFDVPGHGSSWMHPMGRHRFFFKDNSGNYLTFAVDRDGRSAGVVVHYTDAELELQRKGD